MTNREAFLRRMIADGYIMNLDLEPIRELVRLLGNVSNNINQIARKINSGDSLYKDDVAFMQKAYYELLGKVNKILTGLRKITSV